MKKVKLISSLLSFCFALAVLCFGVYAAQSVNYTVGGTLTYSADGVYVNVQGKMYQSTNNALYGASAKNYASNLASGTLPGENTVVLKQSFSDVKTYDNGQVVELDGTEGATGLNLTFGAYDGEAQTKLSYAYYLVLDIHNYGTNPIQVLLREKATGNTYTNTTFSDGTSITINATENDRDGRLVFAIALTDLTISASGNFAFEVVITEIRGFAVSVSTYQHSELGYAFYSTDNGATWNAITGTGRHCTCEQIKFKVVDRTYENINVFIIQVPSLGIHITADSYRPVSEDISANKILSASVSDVAITTTHVGGSND